METQTGVTTPARPSEAAFLTADASTIAAVAPQTMVYAPGGTRRDAALAGIGGNGREFARWSRARMLGFVEMVFRHGVQHLFTGVITPNQWREVGSYRDQLLGWVAEGLAGPDALAEYAARGWRVRLLGAASIPELAETADRLRAATPPSAQNTLWWWAIPTYDAVWAEILAIARESGAQTRPELIRAMYGEDVPLVGMHISFAKPEISPAHLPPLLMGQTQCYWTLRLGYNLPEDEFRKILYDYAYLRPTWRADKTGRAEEALSYRGAWEQGPTLGV
ncbi:MAG TPA: hypothetical protein VM536_21820, partial [Chloroflexia bacterium]|nr:hypothetical protein [Chloroflexia bacterium]